MQHKGHHQRGYLPHRDYGGALQAITFREADSLPTQVINDWKCELHTLLQSLEKNDRTEAQQELFSRISRYEDAGHGRCTLRDPKLATILQDIFLDGHDTSYRLIA